MKIRNSIVYGLLALAPAALVAQNTQQPDRVLYDSAVKDIQKGRFERARLSLQTLTNTYSDSPLMPDAKFAIADSWYREGGSHGVAQAEVECKDLIVFFPGTPSAAKAQELLRKIQAARTAK